MSRTSAGHKGNLDGLNRKIAAEALRADKAEARERQAIAERDAYRCQAEEAQAALASLTRSAT